MSLRRRQLRPLQLPIHGTPLADGPHSFEVHATDRAGNTDPTPAGLSFAVASGGSLSAGAGAAGGGTGATIAPASTPTVQGAGSAGSVRVSRAGSFALKKHLVECPAGGPSCAVRISVAAFVAASAKKRKAKLGGSSYTIAPGKKGAVKARLTKKGQRLLRRSKRVKATTSITVTKGAKVATKKVKVTLKAPGRE